MSNNKPANNINPYNYHQALVNLVSTAKKNFVLMGELLYLLKSDDNYLEAVGEGIDSWVDYIKQPEIGLSLGEANRLVQIYEQFVIKFGYPKETIADIPIKNLHYLLPVVKQMEKEESDKVDDLLGDATLLSQRDFKERVYDIKSGSEDRTYSYIIMKKCNETNTLSRVYDIPEEEINNLVKKYEN